MATGYWCRTAATRSTFVGEWMRTGDMYERDDDGYYTYLGRADDMFKVAGEWVSPIEVEGVLIECPGVLEAAVVSYADGDGLLKAVAFVVASDGAATEAQLVEHCRARLAGFKRPKRFEFVEQLPKTATGKIKRGKAFKRHILTSKDTKRKRQLDTDTLVSKADTAKVLRMIPY